MGAVYEIPFNAQQESFNVTLAGVSYQMRILFNNYGNVWELDIYDSSSNPLVTSIPLVTGVDLLSPYPYLNFGGRLYAATDNSPYTPPTLDDLGLTGHLYFVVYP